MDSISFSNILIIQTAFIGDVILATSVLENIRESAPKARIDFLVRKGNESLLTGNPHLGEIIIWNKEESKYKSMFEVIKKIRRNKYDLLVNIQRYFTTGLISVFSGAKQIAGFSKNPFSVFFLTGWRPMILGQNLIFMKPGGIMD